jgi:hypothetical protein
MRAKFVYEKFIEDSDPVHDMKIGRQYLWKKEIEELERIDSTLDIFNKKYKKFCKNIIYKQNEICKKVIPKIIYHMLKELIKNNAKNELKTFEKICNGDLNDYIENSNEKKIISDDAKNILEKVYGLNLEK